MVRLVTKIRKSRIYRAVRSNTESRRLQCFFHGANNLSKKLIRTMYAARGYKVSFSGTWMYIDPVFLLEHEIPLDDPMLSALLAYVKPGDVFVDVGAYIGMYSIPLARKFAGKVNVVAFEPSPHNFGLLEKHVRINRVEDEISAFNMACGNLSDDRGDAFVDFLDKGQSSESKVFHNDGQSAISFRPSEEVITIKMVSLDRFMHEKRIEPTIIKIDTEGYELHVLKGCREIMRRYRPRIFCEIHRSKWGGYSSSEEELFSILKNTNYCIRNLEGEEVMDLPYYGHVILSPLGG